MKSKEISPTIIKIVAGVVGLVILMFIATKTWGFESHAASVAATKNQQAAQYDSKIQDAHMVATNFHKWHSTENHLEAAIPVTFGLDNVIQTLTNLAQASGVVWTEGLPPSSQAISNATSGSGTSTNSSSTTAPKAPASTAPTIAGVSSQPMTIQVTGSLAQLESFITGVSNLPRLITVTGIQVSNGAAPGTSHAAGTVTQLSHQVQASLSLVVYSLGS